MVSLGEALAIMMPHYRPLPAERIALTEGFGRHLARDVTARFDQPGFDNSAMDGYALAFDPAVVAGSELPVVGESRAGGAPPAPLAPGTAMRIFTGAPLPTGADTVLIQENADRREDRLRVTTPPARAGQHVRARGSDTLAGAVAVRAGQEVGAGEIAALAAQGYDTLDVHRAPRVAILSTGDELCGIGEAGTPGRVVNTNGYALSALVRAAGGIPWRLPTAPDQLPAIKQALSEARTADLVLTSGGVSVGDYDLVGKAFAELGVTTHVWKVGIKPGKPVLFGTLGSTPLLGLPGNPVSAMVTFELFARPGLRRLAGSGKPFRALTPVRLGHAHRRSTGRLEFARASLSHHEGPPVATLHATQGSGSLSSMCDVQALVMIPAERAELDAGEELQALVLGAGHDRPTAAFGGPHG